VTYGTRLLPRHAATARVPSPPSPRQAPAPGPGPQAPAAPAAAGSKKRDAFFDNAKYLAIVLVAMGHAWEPLYFQSRGAAALYLFVFAFHMPAFILISGHFSRTFELRGDKVRRLVSGVLVPYLVFQVAYVLFKRWAGGDPSFSRSLLDPWFLTWFLLALFIWRLTAPFWRMVRWPVPLALAIGVGAALTPSVGDDLALQRVLQFLPFFVLGMRLEARHFHMLRRRSVRVAAVPVFAGALTFAYWAVPRMNDAWLYHTDSAQKLGAPWYTGAAMELGMFGCSLVLTACFLSWVPGRRLWCTALGAGTLYGYLLHGFAVKGSRFGNWYDAGWLHTWWGGAVLTLVAGVVVTLLCTSPVRRVFRFVMEPNLHWAFKSSRSS
jgi:fucose 4-O-acetylase-like acetyltransferase